MKKAANDIIEEGRDKYIAREFDRAAGGHDQSSVVRSYQRRVQILVIDRMRIEKGMNILDLGCGTGQGAMDIAVKPEGTGNIVGMDLSGKMIKQAKKKAAGLKYGNFKFLTGSAGTLEYRDYLGCAFSTNAFHPFEKREAVFKIIWQSLKQNGSFYVQDICDDYLPMKIVDLAGKIGERAHVGSTTSGKLKSLFLTAGIERVEI